MSAATTSRWARLFVAFGALSFVTWQLATLAGLPRRVGVALGLYGFVFHVLFGKAYSLVPSYFDRQLAIPRAPAVHLPLTATGTLCLALAAATVPGVPSLVGSAGATLWAMGVAVFLAALGWTVRDNLTGAETATGGANEHRRPVDRWANLFVPVALAYLAVGTYGTLALWTPLPPIVDGFAPRVTHLLAAGTATLMVLAVGFRLLPRFLVASPPRPLVALVLPAGAVAPAILAATLYDGIWFQVGAALQGIAVGGFALAYVWLFVRTDRDRVGFYGVLAGAVAGLVGVALGVMFAFSGVSAPLIEAHYRLNVAGFLGLTIVGVSYQFYPPAVGSIRGVGDRTAFASIGAIAAGLGLEVAGLVAAVPLVTTAGRGAVLVGVLLYAWVVLALFWERHWRGSVRS
ncbi:hypothetical protein SAMN05216559_0052 [Halomicrobium zhouii]|uniref:Uncharacterized protein n=1 Tax=Halomicrobium zhouii TaxID=767519 RepID=A0A1I6K202_9EURY|nr:hypothetical protein [Halomicrobium zhouii]SFR85214.1 hypothetical protein SAMN05216559_0052 [Halomicrobium zhouii]